MNLSTSCQDFKLAFSVWVLCRKQELHLVFPLLFTFPLSSCSLGRFMPCCESAVPDTASARSFTCSAIPVWSCFNAYLIREQWCVFRWMELIKHEPKSYFIAVYFFRKSQGWTRSSLSFKLTHFLSQQEQTIGIYGYLQQLSWGRVTHK